MPLSLADLRKKTREADIEIEIEEGVKEKLHVVYTPSGYTPALEAEIRNAREDSLRQAELAASMLSKMLVSWDLTSTVEVERDGEFVKEIQPYPCDFVSLLPLPVEFLNNTLNGIVEDMRPPEAQGAN